jgi:hypothetical protein
MARRRMGTKSSIVGVSVRERLSMTWSGMGVPTARHACTVQAKGLRTHMTTYVIHSINSS